jgi:DNA-damage-inducible protein J
MAKSAVINVRTDPETKRDIETLFSAFGISVSDAINIFFKVSLMHNGLPFEMQIPKSVRPPFEYGSMSENMWMADDFDAPLEDFKEHM